MGGAVKPRRIAYVITDLHTGGVPLHLFRLATAVRERGWQPHVISLAPPGAVTEMLREQGVVVHDCAASGAWDWRVIPRLAVHLRALKADLVHSFLFHANLASCLAVPLGGCSTRRLICEIQTVEIERTWHLTVGGMTHRMCRCVVGNSPSVVEHLRTRAHMAASRLRCIPGGVDVERIKAAPPADRRALGLGDDEQVILWVGRFDPIKGLDELIDAFAIVVKENNAKLLLAGEGAYEPAIRRRVDQAGLVDRVMFLGRRTDVASLLKIADVFVLPSRTEGMPNALLEAMAAGRAIVTTDVPGCRDVVENEVTGMVVPSRDVGALAGALSRSIRLLTVRIRLGAAAAEHVAARFTQRACFDRYLSLYAEVAG